MTSVRNNFGFVNIGISNNYTMAINDLSVMYSLPIDIFGVYGGASRYVTGGVKIVITLPP